MSTHPGRCCPSAESELAQPFVLFLQTRKCISWKMASLLLGHFLT